MSKALNVRTTCAGLTASLGCTDSILAFAILLKSSSTMGEPGYEGFVR